MKSRRLFVPVRPNKSNSYDDEDGLLDQTSATDEEKDE